MISRLRWVNIVWQHDQPGESTETETEAVKQPALGSDAGSFVGGQVRNPGAGK